MGRTDASTPTPDRILQTGTGFWAAKVLLTAVKLGLFTELARGPRSAAELQDALGLHDRSLYDFLDALVALGFLERDGIWERASYRNAPDAEAFLDRSKPAYVGGILEMADDRLYRFWDDLDVALATGEPQCEVKHEGLDLFDKLYGDPDRMRQFLQAMADAQKGAFRALAEAFDFDRYHELCDIGGALGALSIEVARRHPHMRCVTLDLPAVAPLARQHVEEAGVDDRVHTGTLDFWVDPFPGADVITMGNVLHDWDLAGKKTLIGKAFDALGEGGVLIVIENIIDDARRENAFGLLMSLNMLIETRGGFDFTGADFDAWAREAGFRQTRLMPLAGPTSAALAFK